MLPLLKTFITFGVLPYVSSFTINSHENNIQIHNLNSNIDQFMIDPAAKVLKNIRTLHVKRRSRLFGVKHKSSLWTRSGFRIRYRKTNTRYSLKTGWCWGHCLLSRFGCKIIIKSWNKLLLFLFIISSLYELLSILVGLSRNFSTEKLMKTTQKPTKTPENLPNIESEHWDIFG